MAPRQTGFAFNAVAVAEFGDDCLRNWGLTVVDAPLSGGTIGAEVGRLSIMV
ncbi:NAD(P)-binding domain-containing protein [Pseudarthrobacter sulfonivorans]|uniref:NAD(P)-binding domain-containing protein n=1 Tax=Pseudarthrobacter sulfonivorans TaxID=121292 RepID=UPI001CC2B4F1|nr:NAD(P)-binding domain-containing protein [Pseudarthrobacter sulfonivorans]